MNLRSDEFSTCHKAWLEEVVNKTTFAMHADESLKHEGTSENDAQEIVQKIRERFPTELSTAQRMLREKPMQLRKKWMSPTMLRQTLLKIMVEMPYDLPQFSATRDVGLTAGMLV